MYTNAITKICHNLVRKSIDLNGGNSQSGLYLYLKVRYRNNLHLQWCIIYLDDIIVFSKTPEEHLERLRGVFEKLSSAGLKLKPSKCEFLKAEINYLGHVVSKEGIRTDDKKIQEILNGPFQQQ